MSIVSAAGPTIFPLVLADGLYSFSAEPIHPSDDRYRSLLRLDMTAGGPPEQAGYSTRDNPGTLAGDFSSFGELHTHFPSPLGAWTCKLLVGPTVHHRILAFPASDSSAFDSELRQFCDGFLSPVASPPARRTYDPTNLGHMADLSTRFMGIGDERLRRTIELNRGLLPATGRVPVHPFPQGKFRQGKTPRVSKGKVNHLHRASICEVVFTDTFETGDYKYRYGQAFVD
jgi:hypothetical protein